MNLAHGLALGWSAPVPNSINNFKFKVWPEITSKKKKKKNVIRDDLKKSFAMQPEGEDSCSSHRELNVSLPVEGLEFKSF